MKLNPDHSVTFFSPLNIYETSEPSEIENSIKLIKIRCFIKVDVLLSKKTIFSQPIKFDLLLAITANQNKTFDSGLLLLPKSSPLAN